jgi:hypothetical protein
MAVMMAKLYQALRAANVSDDAAREAAEEAAAHENRFTGQPPGPPGDGRAPHPHR